MRGMVWHQSAITSLTALWATGASATQIGKRMGITRNAVIGKAHRLKLRPRRYAHDPWTDEDVAMLSALWPTLPTRTVAKRLRRTEEACIKKAGKLSLSRSAP